MRWTLCAFIILAATARAEFVPPTVDPNATPADVHFDEQGNLVIGATGVLRTPEVYPDRDGGYYESRLNITRYLAIAPSGTARWYDRQWYTYGTLDRPPPPSATDELEPATWGESSTGIQGYVNFRTSVEDRFGVTLLSAFIVDCVTSTSLGYDLMQKLAERAPCARHAIETHSRVPYFHIMMWREQYRQRGIDIWQLDPNQSGIFWWRNRAVLANPDWNANLASNRSDLEVGGDPLAPAYLQSLVPDDAGNLILVPDHFAWNACVHKVTADAGADSVVEAGADGLATLTLDGSRSSSDVGSPLSYSWESLPSVFGMLSGVAPIVSVPLGMFSVTLTVSDNDGNSATDTMLITVRDTTAPILSGLPPDTVLEQATPAGTSYTLTSPTGWDLVWGTNVVITSDAPPLFPAGATLVTFTAADGSGNIVVGTTTVTVVDTTPPVLSNLPAPITAAETDPGGTPVTIPLPSVNDAADANPTLSSDSPALFSSGTTMVTFTARDRAGNVATATVSVTIISQAGFDASLSSGSVCALQSAALTLTPKAANVASQTLTVSYSNHVSIRNGGVLVPSGSSVTLGQGALSLSVTGMLPGTAAIAVTSGSTTLTLSLDVTVISTLTGTGPVGQSGSPLVLTLGAGSANFAVTWSHGNSALGRYTIRGPLNANGTFPNNSASFNFTRAGNYIVTAWGDGNGNGAADAAEQPRTLSVTVVDLDYLLALDQNWFLNIGINPGLTRMNARCGRQNVVSLILNAGFSPSNAGAYVRWSLTKGAAVLQSGNFSAAIVLASAAARPGDKLSINTWVDCNHNGVQDANEPARSISVNVSR